MFNKYILKNKKSSFVNWLFIILFLVISIYYFVYFYRFMLYNNKFLEELDVKRDDLVSFVNQENMVFIDSDTDISKLQILVKKTFDLKSGISVFLDGERFFFEKENISLVSGKLQNDTLFENSIFEIDLLVSEAGYIKTGISIEDSFTEEELYYCSFVNEYKIPYYAEFLDSTITLNQEELNQINQSDNDFLTFTNETLKVEFFESTLSIFNSTIYIEYKTDEDVFLFFCIDNLDCPFSYSLDASVTKKELGLSYNDLIENKKPFVKINNSDSENIFELDFISLGFNKITN